MRRLPALFAALFLLAGCAGPGYFEAIPPSSADQAVECKTYLRDAEYDQADALEASGDLQGAYDLFSSLSGYRDAAQRAETLAAQLGIQ